MYDGLAVFYFDEEFDRFMALRATGLGQVNMYDNPTNFTVYGNQVFSRLWTPATASDLVGLSARAGLGHHRHLLAEAGGVRPYP